MPQLSRQLSTFGLTMVAIGSCIGSGIFLTPSMIADRLMSSTGVLAIWLLGGIVALCGALSFAELGVRFPKSGGVYAYLREAYGDLTAFLYGWTTLTVITSGAIAALSIAFARYIDFIVPIGDKGIIILAITGIVTVTLINLRGVRQAEMFSNIFTIAKIIGIMAVGICGLVYSLHALNLEPTLHKSSYSGFEAYAGAMVGIVWSFGGWHHASYLAGEAKDPSKSVPKAMIRGVVVVTIMYLVANLAYLRLLGVDGMASSTAVASDALNGIFSFGAVAIAVLIAISTFGSKGIYTLSAPRIYHAMAEDGVFFPQLARIHPVYKTPIFAILLQSGWAIVLVLLWQTFENLITYVVFMDWVFMTLAAFAVFMFRKRSGMIAEYSIPLYPVTPLVFIIVSSSFLIFTLVSQPEQALAGLILLSIGVGVFYLIRQNK